MNHQKQQLFTNQLSHISLLQEIEKLEKDIVKYNHSYYVENQSLISDTQYDTLREKYLELKRLFYGKINSLFPEKEPESLEAKSDLSAHLPKEDVLEHQVVVQSLDKASSIDAIKQWMEKILQKHATVSFTIETKIDGFSILCYYENGQFKEAISRGDGYHGEKLTHSIQLLTPLFPLYFPTSSSFALRGEIYIEKQDFIKLKKDYPEFSNPRNLASGLVRRKNLKQNLEDKILPFNPLKIKFYDIYPIFNDSSASLHLNDPLFSSLKEFRHENQPIILDHIEEVIQAYTKIRNSLAYQIDGLVIKVVQQNIRDEIGKTSHHPKWAKVYKFLPYTAISTLEKVEFNIGRTGKLTPLGWFSPVEIGGSIIQKATLHHIEYIQELDLCLGDKVLISKQGDIIPAIIAVTEKNTSTRLPIVLPECCPSCQSSLIQKGIHYFCDNTQCPQKLQSSLLYFCQSLEMDGLGKKLIQFLFTEYHIHTPIDLYRFDFNRLTTVSGFGKKKIQNIQNTLNLAKKQPFSKLISSLGIPEIGEITVKLLMKAELNTIDRLYQAAQNNKIFENIQGIGVEMSNHLVLAFQNKNTYYMKILNELHQLGFSLEENQTDKIQFTSLKNKRFTITGVFQHYSPRKKLIREIEKRGGIIQTDLSQKTNFLIAGENPGSKIIKAKKLNIKIIDEKKIINLLN